MRYPFSATSSGIPVRWSLYFVTTRSLCSAACLVAAVALLGGWGCAPAGRATNNKVVEVEAVETAPATPAPAATPALTLSLIHISEPTRPY